MTNYDSIPEELKDRQQWLLWSSDSNPPKAPQTADKHNASWNDPGAWLSFEKAKETAEADDYFDGIGFVVVESDPFIGLDLDGCLREKFEPKPKNWLEIPDWSRETWMEYSTSGTGIHAFTKGDKLPDWWSDSHFSDGEHEGVEAYTEKFFALTGQTLEIAPEEIEEVDINEFLSESYEEINGDLPDLGSPSSSASGDTDVDIGIYDILSSSSYPEGENKPHPFHPSDTGTNFRVHEGGETWRCWRHDVTGNAVHLLGIEQGVIRCGEWSNKDIGKDTWREIFDEAREAGYGIPEPKTANGGVMAEQPSGSKIDSSESTNPVGFNPIEVLKVANGDPEEDTLRDLRNDEIAYAVGQLIERSEKTHFRWTRDNSELYAYDEGVWVRDAEDRLREVLHYGLRDRNSQRMHGEVAHALKSRPTLVIERDELGAPDGTIAVENGLLDLRDRELEDLSPYHYATNQISVEFDPKADYEGTRWAQFLEESVRVGDMKKLQEYAGYLLWHHAQPFGKAMFLIGPRDAGKGVFLDVIESILGEQNVASQSLYNLMQSRWGTAELFGKMANIRNEVSAAGLKNVETFKELTGGGDRVSAERKGQDPFKFRVIQKFMFSTNQVPTVEQAGDPFFSRLLFVKFPETVPESEQEPREKFINELLDESSAILNWMLDGLERLLEQQGFSDERDVSGKRDTADAWGSTIDRFKHNVLKITGDVDDKIHKSDLFDLFNEYADYVNKPEDMPQQTFTSELKSESGVNDGKSRQVEGDGTDQPHVYTGVQVNERAIEEMGTDMPRHSYSEDTDNGSSQRRF